jgi:PAS domain S-box-containing protein/diguanylate cyclase (GGDEF)-like protein
MSPMSQLLQPEVLLAVLESLQIGLCVVDREGRIVLWNDGAERVTGYLRQEVIGNSIQQLLKQNSCDVRGPYGAHTSPLIKCMQEGSPREAQILIQHKSGHRVAVHAWATPIRDSSGAIIGAAESFDTDSEESLTDASARTENLAIHHCLDLSCEVPNRVLTQSYLREQLAIFAEHGLPFGVLCVRVEDFSHLRSAYGRSGAEAVLRMVVTSIKHHIGHGDFVGRWAENEFVAVLTGCTHRQLEEVANSINAILADSDVVWWGDRLPISVTLERSMVNTGDTIESLLKRVENGSQPV